MGKRGFLIRLAAATGALLIALVLLPGTGLPRSKDYSSLVELLRVEQKEEAPLYVFNTFEETGSRDDPAIGLTFFNERPALVRNIRRDLGGGEIAWRLEHARQRLLFVPEKRETFARLFEAYCKHAIDYTLKKTELENPYVKIVTLQEEIPALPQRGVTVFLVHNLAREVVDTYVFRNPDRDSLKIELRRKTFLGEVGSYTTNIRFQEKGEPEFIWDRFTIWQTTARNPFTVLCVPVEETLHIALREHTHRAIREGVATEAVKDTKALEEIVDEWMAVEEALVGGVTYALLPGFLNRYAKILPDELVEQDLEARSKLCQYRHLGKGIEVVRRLGHEEAIRLYVDHPENFKGRLLQRGDQDHSARSHSARLKCSSGENTLQSQSVAPVSSLHSRQHVPVNVGGLESQFIHSVQEP